MAAARIPRPRHSAIPPSTPSQVLRGETRGASLTRPTAWPTKYAPVSAAKASASTNSAQRAPCGHALTMCMQGHAARHQRADARQRRGPGRRCAAEPAAARAGPRIHQATANFMQPGECARIAHGQQRPASASASDQHGIGRARGERAGTAGTPTIPRRPTAMKARTVHRPRVPSHRAIPRPARPPATRPSRCARAPARPLPATWLPVRPKRRCAPGEVPERLRKVRGAKVRPQRVGEVQLGVGAGSRAGNC